SWKSCPRRRRHLTNFHMCRLYTFTLDRPQELSELKIKNRDRSIARCINGRRIASTNGVRIRIIRPPTGAVDGISLRDSDMGRRYDLPSSLAQYLVAQGFAFLEMRQSARSNRWRPTDRRKDAGMFAVASRSAAWAF